MEEAIGPQELSNINRKIQIIEKKNALMLIFFVISATQLLTKMDVHTYFQVPK